MARRRTGRRTAADIAARPPSDEMVCWPVSPRVGNVKNNDPGLVEPITLPYALALVQLIVQCCCGFAVASFRTILRIFLQDAVPPLSPALVNSLHLSSAI